MTQDAKPGHSKKITPRAGKRILYLQQIVIRTLSQGLNLLHRLVVEEELAEVVVLVAEGPEVVGPAEAALVPERNL